MARQKDDGRGRLGGRRRGTPNKATQSMRERIDKLLCDNFEQVRSDFSALSPRDRLFYYERLLQYILPKRQQSTFDISTLNDEQINDIATQLLDTIEQ